MKLATPEMFCHLGPDSFQQIPSFPAFDLRTLLLDPPVGGRTASGAGGVSVQVMRGKQGVKWLGSPWHMHHFDWQIVYVTKGWADFEFEGVGMVRLREGTIMNQPPMNRHREGEASHDHEAVVVASPAAFKTTAFIWDEARAAYRDLVVEDMASIAEFAAYQGVRWDA